MVIKCYHVTIIVYIILRLGIYLLIFIIPNISGYYEVNTDIVRETMKVVTPPITDMSTVGTYIARECQDLPTYMLKKVNPTGELT